jgi:hypothetical protein
MTTLNKLRRLKERAGRPGRCPLAPPPGTTLIWKVVGPGEEPRPEDLERACCPLCGEVHGDVVEVIEEVVIVSAADDQAGGTP